MAAGLLAYDQQGIKLASRRSDLLRLGAAHGYMVVVPGCRAMPVVSKLVNFGTKIESNKDHQRFPCDLPALMTTSLAAEPLLVHILDQTKDGFGLRVPLFLPSGAIVSIHLPYSIAEAEVRYCVKVGNEFGVGVNVRRILTKQ
jgi:hypothetical protein